MRPSRDEWGLRLAEVTAERATCLRRSVGCVLVDARGHVLATGYNGVAAGEPHCNELTERSLLPGESVREEVPLAGGGMNVRYRRKGTVQDHVHRCPGAAAPSGTNLEGCSAIHAEQNALLQCQQVQAIETCYVTTSPCVTCVKLLMNTGCTRIVYRELYTQREAADLWERSSVLRRWIRLDRPSCK